MKTDRPPDARAPDIAVEGVVEVFTAATVTAFEELCQTPVVPGEPYLTHTGSTAVRVAAEITLRRAVPGRLIIDFPRPVLEALVGRYIPSGERITPDIADDAAGEFANVIAGQAKTMLKGTHYHFTLSTPRVGQIVPTPAEGTEFLVLPFDSEAGTFTLRVHLPPCEEPGTIV